MDADVIVIGAGVIGLACAERLAAAGRSVMVLEAGYVGAGATGASLGALMPHAPHAATPLAAAQLQSLTAMPERVARIEGRGGTATHYRKVGRIEILASANAADGADAKIDAAATRWADLGTTRLRRATADEVRDLAPHVAESPHGYLLDDVTAQIDPPAFAAALAAAARADGAVIAEATPVRRIAADAAGVTVTTDRDERRARRTVVASGRAVPAIAGARPVPMSGVKGEAMALPEHADSAPRPLVTGPGGFAIARSDALYIGSTADKTAPHENTVTRDGLAALAGRCRKLTRVDPDAARKRVWSGIRPAAPDGQPVVAHHPERPRVILALGHFKTGLSLAAGTADAVAALAAGADPGPPWDAFGPQRLWTTHGANG
jgi:glycine oxidase